MPKEEKKEKGTSMEEMMEVYRKLAMPGPPHKLLERIAGSWITRSKTCMESGKTPVESTGACEQKMVLGGRFLMAEYTGEMIGSPFKGIGITGYDNHTRKYVSTWMDSMSTGIYFFEGTASADGKTITQESHYDDPVKGPMKWRSVTRIVDDNTHLFEMYGIDEGGNEEKMMEITYTRKQ
jgi:hypothetical protein